MVLLSCGYCIFFFEGMSGLGCSKYMLWFLVLTRMTGYSLLRVGWGCYNKFSLVRCVRSAFGSVRFEACFMCVVLILGVV